MNIFFLSKNPKKCAKYHCDKHCVKMILELCQLLWSAFHITGKPGWENTPPKDVKIYKLTHKNHPSAIWVRTSPSNFRWTASLLSELCTEYTTRYNKIHACQAMTDWFTENTPECNYTDTEPRKTFFATENTPEGCTPVPLAMTESFHCHDLIASYRGYYCIEKRDIATWKYTKTPDWF